MGYAVYTGPRKVSKTAPKYRSYWCSQAQHLNEDGSIKMFTGPAALEIRTATGWKLICPNCAAKQS